MSRHLLRTKSRSQVVGRIAYLTRRGNIWWFRRRHPVLVLQSPQYLQVSEAYGDSRRRVQAKGHLAVSLQTACSREARHLGARLSAHFESAWAALEARVNNYDDHMDTIDNMAGMLTEGFRRFITHYRTTGIKGMAPELRERAFARLDAELREALGIIPLPYADLLTRVELRPGIKYIVMHDPDPNDPPTREDAILEQTMAGMDYDLARLEAEEAMGRALGDSDIIMMDVEDDKAGERLEAVAQGVGILLDQFVASCEKAGLDPKTDVPEARQIAQTLQKAAERLGLGSVGEHPSTQHHSAPQKQFSEQRFSDFAATYLKLRCQGYTLRREHESPHAQTGVNFERTSLRNWQSSVRVFTEIVGDLRLCDVDKDDVVAFNTLIQRLPANFGKSSRDARSARQVIEDLAEEEPQRLAAIADRLRAAGKPPIEIEDALAKATTVRISATTIKRHQTALQSIFEYAVAQQQIAKNPFKGMLLTEAEVKRWKRSEARIERTGWGDAIYDLLGSEVFTEPLDDIGEPLFWAPLIAVYAGLRLEEICQLRVRDFGSENGVAFVAVQNEIGSQITKSDNALRRVPLHRALIDLGLLQLVELRKQAGMNRLFPNMPRSKSKGTLSAIMSKRFGYYIRSRNIKDVGLDFHALRTEFLVRLTRARVPDHVRKGLMGHEQTDVTHANYFRAGETPEALKEFVDRIDIDYRGILPPFGRAKPEGRPSLRLVQ